MDMDEAAMAAEGPAMIGSWEKLAFLGMFFGAIVLKAVWSGFRISEHAVCWWERTDVQMTLTQEEMDARRRAARERQLQAHEAQMEEFAAKRKEEEQAELAAKVAALERREDKIHGRLDSDDEKAPAPKGPREDNPRRMNYTLANPNADGGSSRNRFGGQRRRGG